MPLTDEDKQRIEGREWFEALTSEVLHETPAFKEGFKRAAIRFLIDEDCQRITEKLGAMTTHESKRFGSQVCNFGKHAGKRYDEIPSDYLEWLADSNQQLRRYLNSRRIKEECCD